MYPAAPGRARAAGNHPEMTARTQQTGTGQGPVRFLIPGAGVASSGPPTSVGLADQQDRNELWCFPVWAALRAAEVVTEVAE